jgi:hypothetical protein
MVLTMALAGLVHGGCGSSSDLDFGSESGGSVTGAGGASIGVGGTPGIQCSPGMTRQCVGPGACEGWQACGGVGTWGICVCGSPSTGGMGPFNTGGASALGGRAFVALGGFPVFSGGSPGTGGVRTVGGWPAIGGVSTTGGSSATAATGPGYYTSGPWAGYAWTATSGTSAHIAGIPFCTSGIVAATGDYMLGFNLNQAPDSALLGTWTPASITYGGVQISITNTSGSSLRVQIDGPNGSTDANDRWCANFTGSGAVVPWGAFNTACWDNSGTFYAGQPLASVLLLVLAPNNTPVRFSFCVDNITPAGTGWSNPFTCPAAQPALRAYCSPGDEPCHYADHVCVCGQFYSTDYQWVCGPASTSI